ncbi:glycosyltransferase [Cyanobacterium sp. IPPAS B-1200]|uniref:glycosyltransferase n=1 Tax=Cyanobacterium sp. IPPAS B-1200 TaxID=1562720 RepID=UPI00085265F9|nr:glycosyltransferase [Cyanobacterium sp. IPPAS B-1200]OEJ77780.1 hypothetical protein A5482_04465 [Cyanobacterium sp. IPPAS B-1200]
MNKPKHISFLIRHLQPSGISIVVLNLINSLIEYDLFVDLVILNANDSPYLSQVSSKVRVIDLKTPISGGNLKNPFQVIKPVFQYLREEKPDFLFSNIWLYNILVIIAKILANTSTNLTIIEHDHLLLGLTKSPKSKFFSKPLLTKFLPLLVRIFYPFANKIIAVSKALARDLEEEFNFENGSVKTVYNPIINNKLRETIKESINHPWFESEQPPVVMGVGRLSKEKDFATLIRSIALVRKHHTVRLMILGEGVERKKLENLIKELGLEDSVLMPGFVINAPAYMVKASVFVLSSIREGLSNVLIEAMTCNLPIVSTNSRGGVLEVLDNGKFGEIVPVGDPETMAYAIIRVLNGNGKTFDSQWLKQFSMESVTNQYLKIVNGDK